jgi:CRP-like cAMP-binding protein/ketosteroid isomerase-like protein
MTPPEQIMKTVVEALGKANLAPLSEAIDDDIVWKSAASHWDNRIGCGGVHKGRANVIAHMSGMSSIYLQSGCKAREIISRDDIVWGLFDTELEFLQARRDRRPVRLEMAFRWCIRDGKIVEAQTFFDTAKLLIQLREANREPAAIDPLAENSAAVMHFESLSELTDADRALIASTLRPTSAWKAGEEIIAPNALLEEPSFVASGWVCRYSALPNGQRQLVDLYLPGDLIGYRSLQGARARAGFFALTDTVTMDAKELLRRVAEEPEQHAALASAFLAMEDEVEQHMMDQIIRIGGLQARQRMEHLFMGLKARLARVGLVSADGFELPLSQQILAPLLGISTITSNLVLQQLKREGAIEVGRGRVRILRPFLFGGKSAGP